MLKIKSVLQKLDFFQPQVNSNTLQIFEVRLTQFGFQLIDFFSFSELDFKTSNYNPQIYRVALCLVFFPLYQLSIL